jgi:twitching motility two-component system response regulator PilH
VFTGKIVLIAEDDPMLAQVLALRFGHLGMTARVTPDGEGALALVRELQPDLIVIDVNMPSTDGLSVCRVLSEDPNARHMAKIVLSGRADAEVIETCQATGARHILKDPNAWTRIRGLLEEIFHDDRNRLGTLGGVGAAAPRVLIVDDDPDLLRAITLRLRREGYDVVTASTGLDGVARAREARPDAIIADYTMPQGNGDYLLGRLQEDRTTRGIPVIVLTGWSIEGVRDPGHERDLCGRGGAVAYLTKPVVLSDLLGHLATCVPAFRPSAAVTT